MSKPNFTVSELIKEIQKFPQDIPVLVSGYESGYENFFLPRVSELTHQPENMYFDGEYKLRGENESDTINAVVLEREVRDD